MSKKKQRTGTPQPWAEMLRRNWPRVHSVELHVRTNNRGSFASVPGAAVTIPRPEDETDDSPAEGPEAAAKVAGDMYARAWAHLHASDDEVQRLYFELACYESKDGILDQIAATSVGGALRRDGTVVAEEEQEEGTERERARTREDWMWSRIVERDKMLMQMAKQFPALVEKVSELVDSTIESRAKVASADREMRKDELDARVEMGQTEAAASAFESALRDLGPTLQSYVAWKASESARSSSTADPHESAIVNAARDVSVEADPATVVILADVLGWETVNDLQRALGLAFMPDADEAGIREAWRAIAPALIASQERLGPALPEEKAKALAAAVMRLHALCSA